MDCKDNAGVGLPIFLHLSTDRRLHTRLDTHPRIHVIPACPPLLPSPTSAQVRRDMSAWSMAPARSPRRILGCTDFLVKLYFEEMNVDPQTGPRTQGEDLFPVNGHTSLVWYSVLSRRGYFPVEELATRAGQPSGTSPPKDCRESGSRVDPRPGPSVACGAAQAKCWCNSCPPRGRRAPGGRIWKRHSPRTTRWTLISFVVYNGQQIDGSVEDVMSLGDLGAKWAAFGWAVLEQWPRSRRSRSMPRKPAPCRGKPVVVLMRTDMGRGLHGRHAQMARSRAQRRAVGHRTGPTDHDLDIDAPTPACRSSSDPLFSAELRARSCSKETGIRSRVSSCSMPRTR